MQALTKIPPNQDVFFILLLISFLLFSLIRGVYWKRARLFFMGSFAQRYANQYLREENAFTERLNLLTFLLMVINISLIILKTTKITDLFTIILVITCVFLFFLIKIIVINLFGKLFKSIDLAKIVVFFSLLFDKTIGFVLFPLLVVIYFFSFDILSVMLILSLGVFIFFFFLKLFWLWKIGAKSFGLPQFYIFLYLCNLEIFPIILMSRGIFY